VLERSKHSAGTLLVFIVIANHCHPDGTGSWPSYKLIAKESRMSERGVRYAIEKLEDSEELIVKRTGRQTGEDRWTGRNEYTIPGVVRDGFYTTKELVEDDWPSAIFADGQEPNGKPKAGQRQAKGRPTAGHRQIEVPPNRKSNLELEQETTTTAFSKSSLESKPPSFSTFSSRYYSLVGTTPRKSPRALTAHKKLCEVYGEDCLLEILDKWVESKGVKNIQGDDWAPIRFLEDEAEIMLTTKRVSDSDRKEASYPHGTEDNFDWDEFNKLKHKGGS
jgi:helix-turn-helix protein